MMREGKSRSLDQEVYRALHTGAFGDLQFYRSLVAEWTEIHQKAPKVLELGCGSGRILIELAKGGAEITGVDLIQGALDYCDQKLRVDEDQELRTRVKLICSDFTEFSRDCSELEGSFDLVLITYNSIYCLNSSVEQVALIKDAFRFLTPQGVLWIDGYALPDPEIYEYESDDDFSPLTVISLPNWPSGEPRELGVEERDRFDLEAQRFIVSYRYKAPIGEEDREPLHLKVEEIEHQYIYPWQLPKLCALAGGILNSLTADFGGDDLNVSGDLKSYAWGIDAEHWVASIIPQRP